ncbi:uncharacterized protein LOC106655049 [Trichogramma pretiosum]|uniref:uncharacterized protein LOC106655049 n=1 Tax=Trichogramma pretiosum TaxID=7493 RepID=UPI0006C99906|nr:uncharacterized protein LOC106655049 [Trichogramma pretiosum]XP_014230722.1 uncharacterized protein LOC106655049 [Trichogramma pretiosum]XP_023316207.1 uncharacterized protein LOC106655049 [Trichogramma pretiosum]
MNIKFWKSKLLVFLAIASCVIGQHEDDTTNAFMEAASALLENQEAIGGLQGVAKAFMQSDGGKQGSADGLGQIISGIGSLMAATQGGQSGVGQNSGPGAGIDLSMIGNLIGGLSSLSSAASPSHSHQKRSMHHENAAESSEGGFDFNSMINIASAFMGQTGNAEGVMGLLPLVLNTFSGNTDKNGHTDHSDHSWYMPPILENIHLMWDHFRNSELGQTLWKNSGLAQIVGTMTDEHGNIEWEKIMESFENPTLRRRWINSLTSFVAEWISHVSDPAVQQRYLATAQFIGNSFLKSQGYPKAVMFEPTRPTESLSRLINAVAKRHLNMNVDSYQYVKPAIAYVQELMSLASEKGFIMSRINARELSNKLSDSINNGFIAPLLKAYRAYKWGSKMPHCAAQILCSINHRPAPVDGSKPALDESIRVGLTKVASFPAAWAISNKSNANFWSLYSSILETENCLVKYPADCTLFHEEEIRVTTEFPHSDEL